MCFLEIVLKVVSFETYVGGPGLPLQPTKDETNRLKADPSRLPFGVKFIVQRYGRVVKLGNQTLII